MNTSTLTLNVYLDHITKKIKLKQKQLESLVNVVSNFSEPITKKINEILEKNNVTQQDIFAVNKTNENANSIDIPEYEDIFKELYKKLAIASHPDKLLNEEPNDDFIKIKEAHDKHDLLTLIDFSNNYNIQVSEFIDENLLTLIFERQLYLLNRTIKSIKAGTYYQILMSNDISAIEKQIENCALIKKENKKLLEEIKALETKLS